MSDSVQAGQIFRRLMGYVRPYSARLGLAVVLGVVGGGSVLAIFTFLRQNLAHLLNGPVTGFWQTVAMGLGNIQDRLAMSPDYGGPGTKEGPDRWVIGPAPARRRRVSGVGALAVVGGAVLPTATLASALAHGNLLGPGPRRAL